MRNNYISRRVLDELSKEYSIFFKEEEILYIERYTEVIELKRNEFLIHKDDQLEYLYFVESGILQCSITDQDEKGKEREIVHRFIGGLNMVCGTCDGVRRSIFDITAVANSKIWRMHKNHVDHLYCTSINFNHFSNLIYERAWRRDADRKQMMRTSDAKAKFTYLFNNERWILQNCPLKSVASYLNITPQTLSNIRRNFR
ncbi:Crp/Fnr family transcriptional regulator [Phocaeicola vulgatus]|uniref:Crp/Fnr family transcriptional regulator n=1 Tax=Phocaeicola vulgatus TaxID=821 RepID=UPI001F26D036|nr:cyclic nucleotide-binding domain-containing protein [Phocaeicola vulgatus]MCE8724508.1 cyclic nucleotide-binding domain-containing protein [Phocaeicola vulgatus]